MTANEVSGHDEAAGRRHALPTLPGPTGNGAVVVNGRFLTAAVTGVQRYGREILSRLPARLGERVEVVVPRAGRLPAADAPAVARPHPGGVSGHRWEQLRLPMFCGKDDLLVSLANFGPVRTSRQIVAIHDAAPWRVPDAYRRSYRLAARLIQTRLARRVVAVVTVSERARRHLAEALGIPEPVITVIPGGTGPPFTTARAPQDGYALFVGGHDPKKNLGFLERIWPDVTRATGLRLVAVQRPGLAPIATTEGRRHAEIVTAPDDDELAALYAGAACVLVPSRYEGFGLPLLEGAAAGTPFVASDVGAAGELAVDPAVQLQPMEPGAWVDAIATVVEQRSRLAEQGRLIAARFTWERAAAAWADLIGRVR